MSLISLFCRIFDERERLGVEDLAPQRQHRLRERVATGGRGAAGRVPFHDEQFGLVRFVRPAVEQFAGEVGLAGAGRLAADFGLRLTAGEPGTGRQDDAADDRVGQRRVVVEPRLQHRPDETFHQRADLRVVELVLRLPLKHRVGMKHRQDGDDPFANVVGRDRQALLFDVVDVHVILDGPCDGRPQTGFVGAAGPCADAVDVAADLLVGRLRPLEDELDADRFFVVFSPASSGSCTGFFDSSAISLSRYALIPSG